MEALLCQVGLGGPGDKYPWQLSGGMLQRASLCRALIHEPELLLLDEPFGALDQFTREELWEIMQNLWTVRRTTVVLVTHDLKEAAYLANRICVMRAKPGLFVLWEVICDGFHESDLVLSPPSRVALHSAVCGGSGTISHYHGEEPVARTVAT